MRLDDHGAAAGLVQHWLSRVLPGGMRYSGSVHEQPVHSLPVQRLPLVVGHDGYAPERLAAKRGRNRALPLAESAQTPATPIAGTGSARTTPFMTNTWRPPPN